MSHHNIPLATPTGIEAEIAAQASAASPTWLPPGLDAEIFDAEQLEYLADYITDLRSTWLCQFFELLRTTEPGAQLSCSIVGINAAILAKLLRLTDELDGVSWNEIPTHLHTRRVPFWQQFRLIKEKLRAASPRAANLLERNLRHRSHNAGNLVQYRDTAQNRKS